MAATAEKRFWSKMTRGTDDECWLWLKATQKRGYGIVGWRGKTELAHRVAYALANDVPLPSAFICHSCDTPACCNPAHLWAGDNAANMRDMASKGRSAPQRGALNSNARLTLEQVAKIRSATGPSGEIAEIYGVTRQMVWRIRTARNWSMP